MIKFIKNNKLFSVYTFLVFLVILIAILAPIMLRMTLMNRI